MGAESNREMTGVAVTVGGLEDGSTKFRFGQYLPFFEKAGVRFRRFHRREVIQRWEVVVAAAAEADVIFIQKSLFRLGLERALHALGNALVYDFDDAVWTRPGPRRSVLTRFRQERRLHFWLRRADLVLPANHELGRYARRFSDRVRVFPMALDTTVWRPGESPAGNREDFVLGWMGAPGNLPYLESIGASLGRVLGKFRRARLRVYSGQRPESLGCPFEFVPYAPGTEAAFARSLDVGLLPLPDTPHARGKSPIKALQYLACGVPVVGNFVGASREICRPGFSFAVPSPGDWAPVLERVLAMGVKPLREMGRRGRIFVEENHDVSRRAAELIALVRNTVEAKAC